MKKTSSTPHPHTSKQIAHTTPNRRYKMGYIARKTQQNHTVKNAPMIFDVSMNKHDKQACFFDDLEGQGHKTQCKSGHARPTTTSQQTKNAGTVFKNPGGRKVTPPIDPRDFRGFHFSTNQTTLYQEIKKFLRFGDCSPWGI